MVCKMFFCSKFPDIPDKASRVTRKRRTQTIAKCFAFHERAIKTNLVKIYADTINKNFIKFLLCNTRTVNLLYVV